MNVRSGVKSHCDCEVDSLGQALVVLFNSSQLMLNFNLRLMEDLIEDKDPIYSQKVHLTSGD